MNNTGNILSLCIVLLMLFSCGKGVEYNNHVEYLNALNSDKEQLEKTNSKVGFSFTAQYIPSEKYVLQQTKSLKTVEDSVAFRDKLIKIKDKAFFVLKLSDNGHGILGNPKEAAEEYFAKLQYFMQPAQYDMFIVQNEDTILSKDYHFERYYDYAPYSSLILSFDKNDFDSNKDFQLTFDYPFIDRENEIGIFYFSGRKLRELPKLSI